MEDFAAKSSVKRRINNSVETKVNKKLKRPIDDFLNNLNTKIQQHSSENNDSTFPEILNQFDHPETSETADAHNKQNTSIMQDTIYISPTMANEIETSTLNLPQFLINALNKNSIYHLFPIQSVILPTLILAPPPLPLFYDSSSILPSDICVSAPTGSGKTLCYLLPILARLHHRVVPRLRALIVLPTKDLANQVHAVFANYTKKTDLKIQLFNRDNSFDMKHSPDVIVCTPGKLVDSLKSEFGIRLNHLEFLVVDEADRLLDQSYHEWIPFIISHLPSKLNDDVIRVHCRKFLFSATLTRNPESLSQLELYRPILYTIEDISSSYKYTLPSLLTQFVYTCPSTQDKLLLLYYILQQDSVNATLCFTNSKENTNRLYLFLVKLGFNVNEFSSQLNDKQRKNIFAKFSKKEIDILICTDTMARGIDIHDVKNVINYDCPPFLRNYIHRVGRTARANQEGKAFTILEQCEVYHFKKMMKETNSNYQIKRFNSFQLLPYKEICSNALTQIRDQLDKSESP
ncbi:ATP-dependent RNA helicase DDX51 [Oopsacas minuta]|uniref:ATP-dependent RNA helicase DDX51 n=1 Tax=Oopsacas minuta TaxID=111878 RepID=A0AAV7K405_9METZ|nr:ATP-dependent RNA helicase DDX51 [Oopsacas minuta]